MMSNDSDWVEDVKHWCRAGGAGSVAVQEPDEQPTEFALGYEAAHPALQARHWPDASLDAGR